MNLEDHLGDILSKARAMKNITAEAAARAAELSDSEYSDLEQSGQVTKRPNFGSLGSLLGLRAGNLEAISKGWLPDAVDLSLWRELRWITSDARGMKVHCYLAWDEVTREAALFDTGTDAGAIFKLIDENQLQLKHLFITHSHWDHVEALAEIRGKYPKVRMHSSVKGTPVEQRNRANDFIHLGSLRITNRDTPGHAEDGITYVIGNWPEDAAHVAIVGDAIFAGSMGGARDHGDLAKQKVREQILSLPSETLICPGHGPLTTVGQEKAKNPFFG